MDWAKWFYGSKLCTITPDRILASSMQRNKQTGAQVMQGAFDTYYQGFQAASKVTDVLYTRAYSQAASEKIWKMRAAMEADLRAAADFWVGHDLKFVFQDLAKNNGYWKDDTWNGYKGICNIPMGVSAFLDEVEKRSGQFANSLAEWNKYQAQVKQAADSGRWEKVGEGMEQIQSTIETYGPYLWVCIPGNGTQTPRYVELVSKCLSYAGQIHGVLTKGLKAEQMFHSMRDDPNFKRDLFVETLAAIVGRLPIMGSLYAEVVRNVPNAIAYFKRIAQERDAYITQIMR